MASTTDLRYLTIAEASALLQRREVSPVELTQSCYDLISQVDGQLFAFVTLTPELAMSQAKQAEAEIASGQGRGPLHGIPIGLKDLYDTKGIRTTAHSRVLIDRVPDEDSFATELLARAGSVMLGKLAMHEFAFGTPGFDAAFPPARNPWNRDMIPGGSSSGSGAALAAGLCYGALGSDTGGSIRGPASFCGIVGIKPTYGRVSRYGVLPLSWSLDHAGPMARSVEDCAIILQAIASPDPRDAACSAMPVPDYTAQLEAGVRGLKLAVPRSWIHEGDGTEPEIEAAFEAALAELRSQGAEIIEVDGQPFMDARAANSLILVAEAYAYHERTLQTRPDLFGKGVRDRVREGAFISSADYINAMRARGVIAAQVGEILKDVDAILSPATPRPANSFEENDPEIAFRRPSFFNAFNLTGLPAISVPNGMTNTGLPIGLQIAGRAFDEATVLRIARSYERATPWHAMHPPI